MRFSLTGDLAEAAPLIRCIALSTRHSISDVHIHGALEECLRESFPAGSRRVHLPEEAIVASDTDTVIVADSRTDESIRLIRHASQADFHVLVIPPRQLSTAYSYELHLLLDESSCGIAVLTGSWYLPEEFSVDMRLTDSQLTLPTISRDDSGCTLMHAIDACAALGFASSQVTALGESEDSPGLSRQVVLSGTAADGTPRPAITINCSGSARRFRLQARSAQQSIDRQLILPGDEELLPDDLGDLLCERIARRLPDAAFCQAAMEQFSRTLQVLAAVERSIRRRRTIDVYADELTERSVFKTQMTAIGCGVLAWLILGMIGYLLLGTLLKPPSAVMYLMRALWIAPVVIFLVAQFLLPLARGRQQTAEPPSSEGKTRHDDREHTTDAG